MKNIFIILFVFCGLSLHAQKETWHWYFGSKAGLDFSSGAAIPDTTGKMGGVEGVSIISDSVGE